MPGDLPSPYRLSGELIVGNSGRGTLDIRSGGQIRNTTGFVGLGAGSHGAVTVTGVNSNWQNSTLYVGFDGLGDVNISDGGAVSSADSILGYHSPGTAIVNGAGSAWSATSGLYVGYFGRATLDVVNGGTVHSSTGDIGHGPESDGTVSVTGDHSVWVTDNDTVVGNAGRGTLTIADGGAARFSSSASVVDLGFQSGSVGTLNIGAAEGDAPAGAGTLDAASVSFGAGTGTLVFNHTDGNYVFAPEITGDGTIKVLAGTTKLTGVNSYTGVTRLDGGTLALGNDRALGSSSVIAAGAGAGTIDYADGLIIDNSIDLQADMALNVGSGTAEQAGDITGAGRLAKTGEGALRLSGSNGYSGGTAVRAGILEAMSDGSLGSGALALEGGAFRFGGAFDAARDIVLGGGAIDTNGFDVGLDGTISGAGDLVKAGNGALTLLGDSSYGGNTIVVAGTLVGDAAKIRGDIANAGTVIMDQSADATFAGNVAGAGTMVKAGAGTLSLAGTSLSDWTIEDGKLVASADRFGGDARIDGNSVFTFNQATDGTYAGAISGDGSFAKTGGAGLLLTGDSSAFQGHTAVQEGSLIVDGSLGGALDVLAGARLGGNGTVGATTLASAATLAPGNSTKSLTVNGDLAFGPGSTYEVEVDAAGKSSHTIVNGTATLTGATVQLLPTHGHYDWRTTYSILTANAPITTKFSALVLADDFAFLDAALLYGTSDVSLHLIRNDIAFSDVARTRNQHNVAGALDARAADATGDLGTIIDALTTLTADEARQALNQLSGSTLASFATPQLASHSLIDAVVRKQAVRPANVALRSPDSSGAKRDLADGGGSLTVFSLDRMAEVGSLLGRLGPRLSLAPEADEAGFGAWVSGYGMVGKVDGDGNSTGFDYNTGGALAGVDYRVSETSSLGIAFSYDATHLDHADSADEGKVVGPHFSLYGVYRPGGADSRLVLDGALGFGFDDYETRRHVAFGGLDRTAKADFHGHDLSARIGAGYRLDLGTYEIEPQASLAYTRLHQDGYAETGAGAADLTVDDHDTDSLRGRLGGKVGRTLTTGSGLRIKPEISLAWRHEFGDVDRRIGARMAGIPDSGFRSFGPAAQRDTLETGVGVSVTTTAGTDFFIDYTASVADGETAHSVVADVKLTW